MSPSCQLCDTPKNGITETVLFDNKEKIEVCNDDTTVSEPEWEVQDDSTVDIQSDGSADERENEDDEAEADSNIEIMFQQCLPPLKSRSHKKSTEIVDLTGLESGIKKRLSASSNAVEGRSRSPSPLLTKA